MAILDFYTTTIHMTTEGNNWTISFDWIQFAGTINAGSLQVMSSDINTGIGTKLMLCLDDQVELDAIITRNVSDDVDIPGLANFNNVKGNIAGQPLPNNMCAVLKQVTDAPKAKFNGRIFISGLSEGTQDGGILTAGQVTLLNALGTEMVKDLILSGGETAEFHPGVISRVEGGAPRPSPVFFRADTYVVDVNLRQQRRRTTTRLGIGNA